MPDENKPETETITADDLGTIDDLDLSETPVDPVENTGDGTPVDSIEAAADAAAVDEPAPEIEVAAATPPAEPEPEPAPVAKVAPGKAPATKRTRQTAGKRGKDTAANLAHNKAKKDARPVVEAVEAPPLSDEDQAKIDLKVATRARLREIKQEIEEVDAHRATLVAEQGELANPAKVPDGLTFVERHQQVLKRSTELRESRKNDRLKLLALGAGKSPLDRAMGDGPRKSMAAADATAAENE